MWTFSPDSFSTVRADGGCWTGFKGFARRDFIWGFLSPPSTCWGYSYGLGTLGQNEGLEPLGEELAGTSQRGRSIYLLSPQRTRGRAETIPTPYDEDAEIPPLIGSTWS